MTQICINCSHPVSNESFCGQCGQAQNCPGCKTLFSKPTIYCHECGKHVGHMDEKSDSTRANRKLAFIWLIPCIVILWLIIISSSSLNSDVFGFLSLIETPEKTVEDFFTAIEAGELLEVEQYLHPSIPWDPVSNNGFIPENASIEILNIESDVSENIAVLNVMVEIYPEPIYGQNPNLVIVELERVDGKWLIYGLE